jgi:hypothetical protein
MSEPNTNTNPSDGPAPIPQAILDANPALSKFKDVDALAKSYLEIERTAAQRATDLDKAKKQLDTFVGTREYGAEDIGAPSEVVEQMKAAGMSEEQAKLMGAQFSRYEETVSKMNQAMEETKLRSAWGNNYDANLDSTLAWGKENLSEQVFGALEGSADGLQTIRQMMKNQAGSNKMAEPDSQPSSSANSEAKLVAEREAIMGNKDVDWMTDAAAKKRLSEIREELEKLA